MGNIAVDSTTVNGTVAAQSKRAENVRVYSEDKNIWEGMTTKEAYNKGKDVLAVFNNADKDGDGIISKKELQSYDGLVYTLEKGGYTENWNGATEEAGDVQKQEFYPGLDVSEVKNWALDKYQEIDIAPRDGILSKKEMKLYKMNVKIKNAEGKIEDQKDKGASFLTKAAVLDGGILSVLGGIELYRSKLRDLSSGTREICRDLYRPLLGIGLAAVAVGAVSYFIDKYKSNQNVRKEEQILNNLKKEKATLMKS